MITFINNQNHTLFKTILKTRTIIISRFLTTKSINQNDKDISSQSEDEYNEILKTHQIPGKYLHYFKKNGRQLKRESQFGDEVCIIIFNIYIYRYSLINKYNIK